jgi:uncharacterized protein (TIGR02646 family)
MRPIERGVNLNLFKEYGDARDDLINQLGAYCSYCEMRIPTPAIEHIQPKSLSDDLELEWRNFLLACTSCNSVKKDKVINDNNIGDYFWADSDNTFRAFHYEQNRAPQISTSLTDFQQQIAKNTLELTGIDREPLHPNLSKKDRRWKERNEAWDDALSVKEDFKNNSSEEMKNTIIRLAKAKGFWSVWMTVFADDINMRHLLIQEFKGTSQACFDANTQPIHRAGGQI